MSKLIGTNPNQVPSNADLGSAAYIDAKDVLTKRNVGVSEIDAIIQKTASDVFVYDTTKDSDGGAWRHRTKNTSWYNEKLNTPTRGSRREFPSIAVIVAEPNKVTIYDADDQTLPMWMVFETTSGNLIGGSSAINAVVALNGTLVTAASGYAMETQFIADRSLDWYTNQLYLYNGNIEQRHDTLGFKLIESYGIIDSVVNDVAIKVLPNSPIDTLSGLPMPTIALATQLGISVINSDKNVRDITAGAGGSYNATSFVDISENNYLIFEQDSSSRALFYMPMPGADTQSETNDGNIQDKVVLKFYENGAHEPYPSFNGAGIIEAIGMDGDKQALRGSLGELTILDANLKSPELGATAYIGNNYNTGWQVGDIKMSTLSSTDGGLLQNEYDLIPNGTFDSSASWSAANVDTTISIANGTLTISSINGGGYYGVASAPLQGSLIEGKRYVFSFRLISIGGTTPYYTRIGTASSGLSSSPSTNIVPTGGINALGYHSFTFTATADQASHTHILLGSRDDGSSQVFDDVSLRLAEEDRTMWDRGIQVFGTINKNQVATGAEIVEYSGWQDNANYLEQPYNSELNFGTGPFSITCWAKLPPIANSSDIILDRYAGGSTGRILFYTEYGGQYPRLYIEGPSGSTYVNPSVGLDDGLWHHFHANRRGDGTLEVWIDGEMVTKGGVNVDSINVDVASGTVTSIGTNYIKTDAWGGSLALLRISGTVPTPQQIKKMYTEEKLLFQQDAKATIYGSSNSITALAYDSDTKSLHVGTSQGRSVFQGLRRVEHTTDPITVAISANNGLVAEE